MGDWEKETFETGSNKESVVTFKRSGILEGLDADHISFIDETLKRMAFRR